MEEGREIKVVQHTSQLSAVNVDVGIRGEWGMTGMLFLMLCIFGVSADVGSSLYLRHL